MNTKPASKRAITKGLIKPTILFIGGLLIYITSLIFVKRSASPGSIAFIIAIPAAVISASIMLMGITEIGETIKNNMMTQRETEEESS